MKKLLISITSLVIILLLILIQYNFLNTYPILGVCPSIGIVFLCVVAVTAGEKAGGIIGFIYGMLIDIFFGRNLGMYGLLYFATGYGFGLLKNKIAIENQLSLLFMIMSATVIFEMLNFIINKIFLGATTPVIYLIKVVLIESPYNVFLLYALYYPFSQWGKIVNRINKNYYLINEDY